MPSVSIGKQMNSNHPVTEPYGDFILGKHFAIDPVFAVF
jgi:hypothetical protein